MTNRKPSIAQVELSILRLLLSGPVADRADHQRPNSTVRAELAEVRSALLSHSWANEEHRVVFESLTRMPRPNNTTSLRQDLAAEATRMGHPDVDWHTYFAPPEPTANLSNLLQEIKSANDL